MVLSQTLHWYWFKHKIYLWIIFRKVDLRILLSLYWSDKNDFLNKNTKDGGSQDVFLYFAMIKVYCDALITIYIAKPQVLRPYRKKYILIVEYRSAILITWRMGDTPRFESWVQIWPIKRITLSCTYVQLLFSHNKKKMQEFVPRYDVFVVI